VKNTQKITRAMKMVAGARLTRAQARITALRPYAVETAKVLHGVVGQDADADSERATSEVAHPLLEVREQKKVGILVVTSDRGLCGAFNSSILRKAEAMWRTAEAEGKEVQFFVIGRKGRDYLKNRSAPIREFFDGVWDDLNLEQARRVARSLLKPFLEKELDSIVVLYNQFKSAMTQIAAAEPLFPLAPEAVEGESPEASPAASAKTDDPREFIYEPGKEALLQVLVPMYVEITLLRALYESVASELGARMTAMDSATKNAKDMIDSLTLQYNRARQAAITTELMEIIGGAEALNG
jgi:F-type H+-transporting ATPase subunit gamma